jgi:hypothetical protein
VVENDEHGSEFKFFIDTVLSKRLSGQTRGLDAKTFGAGWKPNP